MIVTQESEFKTVLDEIYDNNAVFEAVIDIETTGLNVWIDDRICGIGLCLPNEQTFYFPFRHQLADKTTMPLLANLEAPNNNLSLELLPELLSAIKQIPKLIGHNIKFDLAGLYRDGYDVPENQLLEDTIIGARMYFPEKHADLSLENLASTLLGENQATWKKTFKDYLKKNKWQNNFDRAPASIVGEYCKKDCLSTYRCRNLLVKFINETGQSEIWERESKLLKVLWDMEKNGMFFDLDYCLDRIPKLDERLKDLEQQIWVLCKKEFNIASTDQITEAFENIGVKPLAKTPTGKAKWSVSELMALQHPVGGVILEYRAIEKIKGTYFEPLLSYKQSKTLHTNFKSWGTVTGRMASSNPNLQNISKATQNLEGNEVSEEAVEALKAFLGATKGEVINMSTQGTSGIAGGINVGGMMSLTNKYEDTDKTVAVRRLYTPPTGFLFYAIDYSQMEMRVFADYVNDDELTRLLEDPKFDFHTHVAKTVWKLDETHSLWDFYRTLAKAINFGLIYGIGIKKLSSQIQKSEEEAKTYRVQYFQQFPKAELFIKKVNQAVISRGWVKNRFGRRYYIPEDRAYVGVNYLVQGTSADIVKGGMLKIHELFKKQKVSSRLCAQVHDELIFYISQDEEKNLIPEIVNIMEARQIAAYLPTDVSRGNPSWAQKEKICLQCFEAKKICLCNKVLKSEGDLL